jgi:hypothetical protein
MKVRVRLQRAFRARFKILLLLFELDTAVRIACTRWVRNRALCHPDEASNASGRKGGFRTASRKRRRFRSLNRALRALLSNHSALPFALIRKNLQLLQLNLKKTGVRISSR